VSIYEISKANDRMGFPKSIKLWLSVHCPRHPLPHPYDREILINSQCPVDGEEKIVVERLKENIDTKRRP